MKQIASIALLSHFFIGAFAQKAVIFSPNGQAIKGYDPVAFFVKQSAIKGYDSLTYRWSDANWYFSSKAHLDSFKANPEKYAPQYGGYCAYGTAQGHRAPTETDTWTVVDDKLYFNYNNKVKNLWMGKQATLIEAANQQWPAIKNKE
jgi:hypothetical protein